MWVEGGKNIPTVLAYDAELKNSPLNAAALEWKSKSYPLTRSDGYHYLKLDELINQYNTGFIQRMEPVEEEIFYKTDELLTKWAKEAPSKSDVKDLYDWLDNKVTSFYENAKADL
jgi:hypothetical protein